MKKYLPLQLLLVFFISMLPFSVFGKTQIPTYDEIKKPYVEVNGNVPFFKDNEFVTQSVENYARLDKLGRCGTAYAVLGKDIMPEGECGEIGMIKPTGWKQAKYAGIVDSTPPYLYNRCHLIGFQLSGENANERNLITGTRYLNIEGMLPFENRVADYIRSKGNHVLYRVTPKFEGNNLLASGVLMEASSVEDKGKGLSFCVFCYNVQPGIKIDYKDGSNAFDEGYTAGSINSTDGKVDNKVVPLGKGSGGSDGYIANKNTKKFHVPYCSSVSDMKEKNKAFYSSRDDVIADGYVPCKRCNP